MEGVFMPQELATYRELAMRWKALRADGNFRVREVACVGAARTLLCVESGEPEQPVVTLSAGIHGDERSGPAALLWLAERALLDERFAYRLWPCINPTGYDAATRESTDGIDINRTFGRGGSSPESKAVIMANRDFKFVLAMDLHEDGDVEDLYFYAYGSRTVAEALQAELRCLCLVPDAIAEIEELGGLSYSLLLQRNAARQVYTFEAPGRRDISLRIEMHVTAVSAALASLDCQAGASDSQTTRK